MVNDTRTFDRLESRENTIYTMRNDINAVACVDGSG